MWRKCSTTVTSPRTGHPSNICLQNKTKSFHRGCQETCSNIRGPQMKPRRHDTAASPNIKWWAHVCTEVIAPFYFSLKLLSVFPLHFFEVGISHWGWKETSDMLFWWYFIFFLALQQPAMLTVGWRIFFNIHCTLKGSQESRSGTNIRFLLPGLMPVWRWKYAALVHDTCYIMDIVIISWI